MDDDKINNLKIPLIESDDDDHTGCMPHNLRKYSSQDPIVCKFEKVEDCRSYYYKLSRGSLIGAIFTLLCLTFGSGLLSLPYTFTKIGFILGTICFLIAANLVYITMLLLIEVAYKSETLNYTDLVGYYLGSSYVVLTDIFNLLSNFGGIIIYQQIISNFFMSFLYLCQMDFVLDHPDLTRLIVMYSFCIFTQIPLCLIRRIELLHSAATIGTMALLYTVLIAVLEFPSYFSENYEQSQIKYFDFNLNIFKVFCMYFFSFNNHNAILNVVRELINPSQNRATKVVRSAFFFEFITYFVILFVGYFSTFENTNEIFIDRPNQSIYLLIGKLGYIFSLTCHIALYYFISKPSLEVFLNNNEPFNESK